MTLAGKFGSLVYFLAQVASLAGALMLLTGLVRAAEWNYGMYALIVAYFVPSALGTLGLLVAIFNFRSSSSTFSKIGLYSNIGVLFFASALAVALLFNGGGDDSWMILGLSPSTSIRVSLSAWLVVPIATSLVGIFVSFLRTRSLRIV